MREHDSRLKQRGQVPKMPHESPTVTEGEWSVGRLWHCPQCHGELSRGQEALECYSCKRAFDIVDDIPDFRLSIPSWLDVAADTTLARELVESRLPLEMLVREVFTRQTPWDHKRIERRTREVLSGPEQLHEDLKGWLEPIVAAGSFLDLGCGGGMLLAAAAEQRPDVPVIGVDVSMTWLVVAKRMVGERGGRAHLAAAMAEALPFADESIPALVSLDVIEHVGDPDAYLGEIDRALRPGGRVALSTPNRFSLTAEPHVFVWGVGWLPRKLQQPFVRRRSGKAYDYTVLMSSFTLARKVRRNMKLRSRILVPTIADSHIRHFARGKAAVARLYNLIASVGVLRPAFLCVAPFFRLIGTKIATVIALPYLAADWLSGLNGGLDAAVNIGA